MTMNDPAMHMDAAKKHCPPLPWSIDDISRALSFPEESGVFLNNKNACNHEIPCFTKISTDSRCISKDELFVALKGENFDGHIFLFDLLTKGIKGFIVEKAFCNALTLEEKQELLHGQAILFPVSSTLEALGLLARYQRLRSGVKVVAITGSNGKTTTRKMMASIFEQQFKTLSTTGNFNNEIGLPLTLLKLSEDHEWAVVEMGMNHPGEISRLSRIALPDIAVITNTSDAHLEGMGSVNNVAKAKSEITEGMNPGSTMIINRDDPRREIIVETAAQNEHIKTLLFFGTDHKNISSLSKNKSNSSKNIFNSSPGFETEHPPPPSKGIKAFKEFNCQKFNCVTAKNIAFNKNNIGFKLSISETCEYPESFSINSPAPFMIHNALAACAAAFTAGIPVKKIQKGLSLFQPLSGRMNIIQRGNIHVIDDTYNANPASVKEALSTLKQLHQGGMAIAVLGDMLELGDKSRELHFSVGESAAHAGISRLYAFGEMATEVIRGAVQAGFSRKMTLHGTKDEIIAHLTHYLERHFSTRIHLLVKGSRGMKMEEVIQKLTFQK